MLPACMGMAAAQPATTYGMAAAQAATVGAVALCKLASHSRCTPGSVQLAWWCLLRSWVDRFLQVGAVPLQSGSPGAVWPIRHCHMPSWHHARLALFCLTNGSASMHMICIGWLGRSCCPAVRIALCDARSPDIFIGYFWKWAVWCAEHTSYMPALAYWLS